MPDPRADNTSATGGFLPLTPVPGQVEVEDVLHDLIAGITGLPGSLVRPRWQPEPPREPGPKEDWCAFGIVEYIPHNYPQILHHREGEGHDEIIESETLRVVVSFYGPHHHEYARLLRRGVHVPQNRETLRPAGLAFAVAGGIQPVPELVALGWRARSDLTLNFHRETRSDYPVLNLKKTAGSVTADASGAEKSVSVELGCETCSRDCWKQE
jgi:hypothetical protein